jgi:hypothetical protein
MKFMNSKYFVECSIRFNQAIDSGSMLVQFGNFEFVLRTVN